MHYLYDNTFDGLLTAYYKHKNQLPCTGIYTKATYQVSLFEAYEEIETDPDQADKMYTMIKRKLSVDTLQNVYYCFLSEDVNKEKYIFNYLNLGFEMGRFFMNYHTHHNVLPLLQVVRKVKMESHRFLGYIRFSSLGSVLYCVIHPSFHILPIIAGHFSDRFQSESFVIHDKNRDIAIVSKGGKWVITAFDKDITHGLKEIDFYEDLWKTYFQTVGIESRKNIKLQQSFVPLKYRKDLLEFS